MKTCSRCRKQLPIGKFNHDRTRVDGYSYICKDCWKSNYFVKTKHSFYQSTSVSGRWSKYGGGVTSTIEMTIELSPTWICQSCAEEFPNSIIPHKFEFPKEYYIKVCDTCLASQCRPLMERILEEGLGDG